MPPSQSKPSGQPSLRRHWLARYGFALLTVAAALLLREGLTRLAGGGLPTYITLYPAVMISALFGGIGPGLFATAAAALGTDYFILPPMGSLTVAALPDAVGLAFFSGMGVFMSTVAESYRRARQKAASQDTDFYVREGRPIPARRSMQGLMLNAGLVVSLAILATVGWQSARSLRGMAAAEQWETHTRIVIQEFQRLLSTLQDAETGQRGYLLTGDENYLAPYQTALGLLQTNLTGLKQLTSDNASQQQRLASLGPLVSQKLAVLKQTVQLRRSQGLPAALAVVTTGTGKDLMDQIRRQVAAAQAEEESLLQQRATAKNAEAGKTLQALLAGGVLSFLLLATVFFFLKQENTRRMAAEADVRHHRDHLQELVAARTEALSKANADLTKEIDLHRQARQALRQQREWLSITLASIGDAVLATDTAGRVTFLNPVAEELTGWRESAALGQPAQSVFRIINEQTRAAAPDIVAQVLREGQTVALANHTALIARDGREVPVEDSAAPIQDELGTILGVVLVFHDVTQRRRDQAALHEREEQLQLFVEYAPAAIAMLDAQMRYLAASRQWLADFHLLGQPVIGRSHYELFPDIPERWKAIHRRCLAGVVESAEEDLFERADGAKQWLRWQIRPWHLASGAVGGILIFTEDITARKQAEQQMRLQTTALRSAANGIAITRRDGTIEWVNEAFTRLTGYSAAEAIGRNSRVLKSGAHPPEFYAGMWQTVVAGQVWHGELINKRKDGTLYQEEMTITPVPGDRGDITHFIAIKQDITERKRRESNLALLTELHQAFAPLVTEAEIMHLATGRIAAHLRLSHCLIVEINEAADEAAVLHDHHAANLPSLVGVYRLKEFHTAEEQAMLAAGKTLVVEDVNREPRSADKAAQFAALGIGALVNASYLAKGRWQFVLSAMRGGPCAWPAEDVALLAELAARVCVRIERARAEAALRESETRSACWPTPCRSSPGSPARTATSIGITSAGMTTPARSPRRWKAGAGRVSTTLSNFPRCWRAGMLPLPRASGLK